ncbi:MAG TPA: hypothetical protein VG320_01625, partial [Paraburkholderia sp.]|uniref:hypothetical protein n=1 Tax=Paraburkholderia sp. TaxID=1926495 RepID=UPI002DE65951|nr:hypothetical protein [Paraburkholderia sp.]
NWADKKSFQALFDAASERRNRCEWGIPLYFRHTGSRGWAGRQGPYRRGFATVCKAACIAALQADKREKFSFKMLPAVLSAVARIAN